MKLLLLTVNMYFCHQAEDITLDLLHVRTHPHGKTKFGLE